MLNRIASQVIEAQRSIHSEFVFTYNGEPLSRLHNSAWKRAWKKAGLPTEGGILKGVRNLRHTFGRRLSRLRFLVPVATDVTATLVRTARSPPLCGAA